MEVVPVFFKGRSSRVSVNGTLSEPQPLSFGLPQGSLVGPLGFSMYTSPIRHIINKFGLSYHIYADDIQLYINFDPRNLSSITDALARLTACSSEIKIWMTRNLLRLNDEKTEFFVAVSDYQKQNMPPVSLRIGDMEILPTENVRNLGVIFDRQMTMTSHISSLCSSLNYQLRNISRVRRFLDVDTCHLVVRSLILSRIDYGSGLLLGSNTSDIQRLQRIQNWASKLICCRTKQDHATPCLQELHWLRIRERIIFKIMMIIFKCLNGSAPSYMTDLLSMYCPARTGLRSASDTTRLAEINSVKLLKTATDRSFVHSAPHIWNNLPTSIRESNTFSGFKKGLKTYLFAAYE